jgi:hypothetical protein
MNVDGRNFFNVELLGKGNYHEENYEHTAAALSKLHRAKHRMFSRLGIQVLVLQTSLKLVRTIC